MKNTPVIFLYFCCLFFMLGSACKKKGNPIISIDTDTIFVNDEVRFSVNVDFKVKDEEWRIVETNTSFSNVTSGTYKFPVKGIYMVEYTAKTGLGKKVSAQRKVVIYALPGVIKNYWSGINFAHGDISLWVKGYRYDGQYYEDSVFYEKKYGLSLGPAECKDVYEPEVFLNLPGGRYKCFLKYKYFDLQTIYVEHSDSVQIDGKCEAFNY
jgi:hypothetical protein